MKVKGLTQHEVAEKLGISTASLNKTLKNDGMRVSTLVNISKVLNVSPAIFFTEEITVNVTLW